MQVLFTPKKLQPPTKASLGLQHNGTLIELKPGINNLSEAKVAKLKAHPNYPKYEELGAISAPEAAESAADAGGFTLAELRELNVDEAEGLIKETTDVDLLKSWKADPRVTVQRAIAERLEDLA